MQIWQCYDLQAHFRDMVTGALVDGDDGGDS